LQKVSIVPVCSLTDVRLGLTFWQRLNRSHQPPRMPPVSCGTAEEPPTCFSWAHQVWRRPDTSKIMRRRKNQRRSDWAGLAVSRAAAAPPADQRAGRLLRNGSPPHCVYQPGLPERPCGL